MSRTDRSRCSCHCNYQSSSIQLQTGKNGPLSKHSNTTAATRTLILRQVSKPTPSLEELTNLFATASSSTTTLTSRSATLFPTPNAEPSKTVEPAKPNLIPVYVEIPADLLTPVSAYLKIAKDEKYSYLLESVVGGESLARYSFVGSSELINVICPIFRLTYL